MLQKSLPNRTLHVLVATPSGAGGQGGIDRIMATLGDELARRNDAKLQVRFVPTRGGGHIVFAPFYLAAFLLRMVGSRLAGRLDLVHINLASDGSTYRKLQVARTARLLGVPYVLHLHGADYGTFWSQGEHGLGRRIRTMFAGAARTIVLGKIWRDIVVERAPETAERIEIVPNATSRPHLPHHGGGDAPHILFLGRIGDRKGTPQLVEALERMRDLPWRATIAGDGEVEATRQTVTERGLAERIALPGWCGPEAVASLIAGADILVLPSFAENLPLSIIEGMASGLAVVATPVGAVEEILADGETGLLVEAGNVDQLTAALTRVVTDSGLRTRLGAAALAFHRKRLDAGPFADEIERVWRAAAR